MVPTLLDTGYLPARRILLSSKLFLPHPLFPVLIGPSQVLWKANPSCLNLNYDESQLPKPDETELYNEVLVGKVTAFDRRSDTHTVFFDPDFSEVTASSDRIKYQLGSHGRKFKDLFGGPQHVPKIQLHGKRYFVLGSRAPMRYLIYYDTVMFVICTIALISVLLIAKARGTLLHNWQYRIAFMYARYTYALSAFPYFFVMLPPWNMVFTHAEETGYNEHGICVQRQKMKDYDWVKAGMNKKTDGESKDEANEEDEEKASSSV